MKESYNNFEKKISLVLKKGRSVSVRRFLFILSGKGKLLFLTFFALPLAQIPGFSIFFGLLICYFGLRIGFYKKSIWLPNFIQKKKIPPYFLKKSVHQILFVLKILKRWSFSRYTWATRLLVTHRLNGIMIAIVGISLAMCPPIPFIGTIAFAPGFLIGVGLLNDDSIYLVLGYVFTMVYLILSIFVLEIFSISGIIQFVRNLI
jgi:hypothetical protein